MSNKAYPSSILALTIFSAFAAPASATVISQTLGATSQASASGSFGVPVDSNSPGFVYNSTNINNTGGSGYGFGFANQTGAYAVSSYTSGIGTGQASASLLYSILNDSALTQSLSMRFKIYGGYISTNLARDQVLAGNESLSASYSASIKVDGNSRFSSSASIFQNIGGVLFNKAGVDLSKGNDDGSDGIYQWGSDYITIELGDVASGRSVNVLAELSDSSASNVGTYIFDCGGGGYDGYEGYNTARTFAAAAVTSCTNFKGSTSAFYGDPASLNATTGSLDPAITFKLSAVSTTVPLPGTLALGLMGLAALVASRRKQL
jgi:hypothetical protein